MENACEISVIVPVHNGEGCLARCVDSILRSTRKDIEIILVENASTDGTRDVCRAYEQAHENVRVVSTEIPGLSHARNLGIEAAHGRYIAFVDADDYVSPYIYEVMHEAAVSEGSDFVLCGYLSGAETDHAFPAPSSGGTRRVVTLDEYYRGTYLHAGYEYTVAWNKLIRRDCLGGVRYDEDLRYFEDRSFAVRCVSRAGKICRVDEALYYYWRGNENSISRSVDQHDRMFQIYALQKDRLFMETQYPDTPVWREYVCCCLLQNADFRMKRAKEEKLTDLQAVLKPIVKEAAHEVRKARHLPRSVRLRFLAEHDAPHLFSLAGKIAGK